MPRRPALVLFIMTVTCLLVPAGVARAQPGFPEVTGGEPAWPDGPAGAFRPVQPAGGDTWWVDAAAGSDTAAGTEGDPFATIARALEVVAAGDTVVVRAGVYHEQVMPPDLSPSSTRSRPVTLLADPADGASVIIDGDGVVPVIEGSLQNPAGVSLYNDPAFVVEGFLIRNWTGYGLAVQQSGDALVRGCSFTRNGGEMADSVDLLVISSHDVRVEQNVFDGAGATERGLDDRSLDTVISENRFAGYKVNAVKVGPYPAGHGSRVVHNRLEDNTATQGVINISEAKGVTVQRNLVVGGNLQGIRIDEAEDARVLLNTVSGSFTGIEIYRLHGGRVEGNILTGCTLGMEFLSLLPDETVVDHNLYHGNTVDVEQGDPGPGALFDDPDFEDPGGGDYSLGAGSPAVDAGPADLPVPQGGGGRVDLGAFETGAGPLPWHFQPVGQVADWTPRFVWDYHHRQDIEQGSCRVQLDRVVSFDSEDLLDSNWQVTADQGWTVPDDFELDPGDWYVRVKVQDADNQKSPWSDPHLRLTVVDPPDCAGQGGTGCQPLDGCDGQWLVAADDPRCCLGSCVACPDADADGYLDAACGGDDCDDTDPATHPGAEEYCEDGVDNDCDQLTDTEDPDCGCVDHDRDGYGENCEVGEDCDDNIASVHPGAEELCNYVDDDCDGETDEGFALDTDPDNCGECGWSCRQDEVCDLGECKDDCGPGRSDCDRACIDTTSDPENCGGCGQVCDLPHAGQKCTDGRCVLTACEQGWVDLDGDPSDGCEYECTPAGEEACGNEIDDDCDGQTDEDCDGGGGCGCTPGGARAPEAATLVLLLLLLALLPGRRGP